MTKTVFISRDLDESSPFASRLHAAGWAVHGQSLVSLQPLPLSEIPEADWIFFASKHAVRFFFAALNPTPDPSPEGEGGRSVDRFTSSSVGEEGKNSGVGKIKGTVYSTDSAKWKYLKTFTRTLRKYPTEAEQFMWRVLRHQKFEGLKFRRQHAIDDFIVDFVNLDLKLIVEIDGSIHDIQPEYDQLRTDWLNNLGYTVVRFTNEEVLRDLPKVKEFLRQEISSLRANPTPGPSPEGEGGRDDDRSTPPLPFRGGAGGGVKLAALGPATAREVLRYTGHVDFTGTGDPATTAAQFLPLAQGQRVLFPAARQSEKSIPRLLEDAITAIYLDVYANTPVPNPPKMDSAVLVFTSPLNAQAYFSKYAPETAQHVVAIGRTTATALVKLGLADILVASEPTELALADAVLALG